MSPPPGGRLAQIHELSLIAQPDPWVYAFMGNRQPWAPRQLSADQLAVIVSTQVYTAPGRLSALLQIVTAWQPDPWLYAGMGSQVAYKARQISPGVPGQSIDRPPLTLGGPYALKAEAIQIAQPDPWTYSFMGALQPFGPRNLSAGVPGQWISAPPTTRPGQLAQVDQIANAWQPDPWVYAGLGARQAYMGRQISPGVPGQSYNEPPYQLGGPIALRAEVVSIAQPDPWVYAFMGQMQPFGARRLSPGVPGQSIDAPPLTNDGPLTIKLQQAAFSAPDWNGAAWPYIFSGRTQPYAPSMVAISAAGPNNPSFRHTAGTAAMRSVIRSWDPPPYDFQARIYASGQYPVRRRPTARGYIVL